MRKEAKNTIEFIDVSFQIHVFRYIKKSTYLYEMCTLTFSDFYFRVIMSCCYGN